MNIEMGCVSRVFTRRLGRNEKMGSFRCFNGLHKPLELLFLVPRKLLLSCRLQRSFTAGTYLTCSRRADQEKAVSRS